MSKRNFSLCIVAVLLPSLTVGGVAFGWAGNTHAKLCQRTFDDPVVAPLLSGIDQSEIENWTGEPPTDLAQWDSITGRYYIESAGSISGYDWWSWNETTRLKYLMHSASDDGVPIGHSPANQVYVYPSTEAYLEAQVATWGTWPSVTGTTTYTHNRNGHTYYFTGTATDVVNTFYNACIDNATWYKSTRCWYFWPQGHWPEDHSDAGWNGTTIALMLMRAVIVDYMLAKQPAATIADVHYLSGSNSYDFDGASSYDRDNITWNSNGTYTRIDGDSIDLYYWDFNDDGTWDHISSNGHVTLTASQLLAMGLTPNARNDYPFAVRDDDGQFHPTRSWFYFNDVGGVPEPASLSLLAVGVLAMIRRKR